MSSTLLVLEQNLAKAPGMGYASGTSTSGTTSTLVDSSPDSPFFTNDSDKLYQNAWVKIESDADTTNTGNVRRIRTYTPTSQTLTIQGTFSAAVDDDDQYGIYLRVPPVRSGLHAGLLEYINDTIRNLYYRTYHLLTLVTDGDMETSGITNWTGVNTETLAKSTTAAYIALGKQSLHVDCTAASGYAKSAAIAVADGDSYDLLAECKVLSGTSRLQLYDETNATAIDADTTTDRDWRWLLVHATIPSGCHSVTARLVGDEITADAYWDNVCLRPSYATRMDLPSWVVNASAVEDLIVWSGGMERVGGGWATVERLGTVVPRWEVLEDSIGQTARRIEFDTLLGETDLLLLKAIRPYTELSADTDATDANADLVKAGALTRIGNDLQDRALLARWLPEYAKLLAMHQPRLTRRMRL